MDAVPWIDFIVAVGAISGIGTVITRSAVSTLKTEIQNNSKLLENGLRNVTSALNEVNGRVRQTEEHIASIDSRCKEREKICPIIKGTLT